MKLLRVFSGVCILFCLSTTSIHATPAPVVDTDDSIRTQLPCMIPCWQGLIPGVSTTADVQALSQSLPFIYTAWTKGDGYEDNDYIIWWRNAYGQAGSRVYIRNNVVRVMSISPNNGMTLEDMIRIYGEPSGFQYSYFHSGNGTSELRFSLYYPQYGMIARFLIWAAPAEVNYIIRGDSPLTTFTLYPAQNSLAELVAIQGSISGELSVTDAQRVIDENFYLGWPGTGSRMNEPQVFMLNNPPLAFILSPTPNLTATSTPYPTATLTPTAIPSATPLVFQRGSNFDGDAHKPAPPLLGTPTETAIATTTGTLTETPTSTTTMTVPATATIEATITPVPSVSLGLQSYTDFNAGLPDEWQGPSTWFVVPDAANSFLAALPDIEIGALNRTVQRDMALQGNFFIQDAAISVYLRYAGVSSYRLFVRPDNMIELYRNNDPIHSINTLIPSNTWLSFRFSIIEDTVIALINGVEVLRYTDDEPLPAGLIGLSVNGLTEGSALFDNFAVYGSESQ
jgi:hypothetical protein